MADIPEIPLIPLADLQRQVADLVIVVDRLFKQVMAVSLKIEETGTRDGHGTTDATK